MNLVNRLLCFILFIAISSCSGSQNRTNEHKKRVEIPLETYIKVNKQLVAEEQKSIEDYVSREGLNMDKTQTGLWYLITKEGEGNKITKGKVVTLNYSIHLLDGTLCYSSEKDGHKIFLVGQGGVESGLEEGILMMQEGSKAIFIMPPHLAHGLVGDDAKIPSRAIIRYDVEVLNVRNRN